MVVDLENVGEFNVNPKFGRLVNWQDTQVPFVVCVVEKV
jgi:hypothetical protein